MEAVRPAHGRRPGVALRFFRAVVRYRYLYALLLPVMAWYVVFCYVPMYGVLSAFQNYTIAKGVLRSPWAGLEHFRALFADTYYWRAFRNTLILSFFRFVFEMPVPIILALLMNELRGKGFKQTAQTVMYLPHFLSWIIVVSIVLAVFNPDIGIVASVIQAMGGTVTGTFITVHSFRWFIVGTAIWKEAGWSMIIYSAAISGIDVQLYEAALVDGAGRFRRAWHVTLPGIRSTIAVVLILNVGGILSAGFDQVFNLQNPLNMAASDVIETYVYRTITQDFKLSYATAAGLVSSVISMGLLLLANGITRSLGQEGIY